MLSILVRESQLDTEAYFGKGWKKGVKEIKKEGLGEYPGAAGLGGIRATAANQMARVVSTTAPHRLK